MEGAARVHLLHRGREHHIHAVGLEGRQVPGAVRRVAVQVGGIVELGGVQKKRRHQRCSFLACPPEQRLMPFVHAPEGGHHGHGPFQLASGGVHARDGGDDLHSGGVRVLEPRSRDSLMWVL